MKRYWWFLLASALIVVATVSAQFGGMGGPAQPETSPVKSDIKYIKCEVCQLVAKHAYRQVKAAEKDLKPGKKLKEFDVIEMVEKVTNPNKDEGEWIMAIDLVESGDKLLVKEMEQPGTCGTECKTVQRAAEEVAESADTDMAEKLWQGKMSRAQFSNWLCTEATTSCKRRPPKLPRDRPAGPEFEPMDPEELKMQKMMATMKEMGMGGSVFNRDQAQRYAQGGVPDEYDDDYGDDSTPPDFGAASEAAAGKHSAGKQSQRSPDFVSQATEAVQATVDSAIETGKQGWNMAKQAGMRFFSKAQDLLGSGAKATDAPASAEL